MIIFPIFCTVIAALCAGIMGLDTWRRPRPDKIVWTIAFALFAVAAGVEVIGSSSGWTTLLARTYYATGVALVVVFLAAGQMFLLFPEKMKRFGFGVTLLVVALWVSLVLGAPVDQSRLATDGWDAIVRGTELKALGIFLNALGTLIIVGGSGWAVVRYWRTGTHRNRMIGCLFILVGTLVVASGGSLQRLGNDEFLYIAMAAGVAIIFAGVLFSRTPDTKAVVNSSGEDVPEQSSEMELFVPTSSPVEAPSAPVAALRYVEHLLSLDDAERNTICHAWSVARIETPWLTRNEARAAWHLRSHLSGLAVKQFDTAPVPARRQLSELFDEVLIWPEAAPHRLSSKDDNDQLSSLERANAEVRVWNGEGEFQNRTQIDAKLHQ